MHNAEAQKTSANIAQAEESFNSGGGSAKGPNSLDEGSTALFGGLVNKQTAGKAQPDPIFDLGMRLFGDNDD